MSIFNASMILAAIAAAAGVLLRRKTRPACPYCPAELRGGPIRFYCRQCGSEVRAVDLFPAGQAPAAPPLAAPAAPAASRSVPPAAPAAPAAEPGRGLRTVLYIAGAYEVGHLLHMAAAHLGALS